MVAAGRQIRDNLIQDYPLGFRRKGDTDTFADIEPVEITVDPGAKPINLTYCKELPPGLESKCDDLIESLLQTGLLSGWINELLCVHWRIL